MPTGSKGATPVISYYSGGKQSLAHAWEAAGHDIGWNKVMRAGTLTAFPPQ
jgi:hypothetical protein